MWLLNVASLSTRSHSLDLSYLRTTFLVLHISGGFIGLPLLILTLLISPDPDSRRQPDLINFCITWVIYSVSYTTLILSRQVQPPPHTLCFIQAAMLQGATPMAAVSTFMLVFKIWRTFRDPYGHIATYMQFFTLSFPYIVFIILLLISVGIQLNNPKVLNANNGLYCTISGNLFRQYSTPTFSIILATLIVGFELAIGVSYYRSRKRIVTSFPLAHHSTSLGLIVRLTIFNVYLFVTVGASVTFLAGYIRPWAYMIQAALPLTAFVLFATQKNVVLAWCFWIRRPKDITSRPSNDTIAIQRVSGPSEIGIDLSYISIRGQRSLNA